MQVVWDADSAVGCTGYYRRTSQSTLLEKNERFSYCLSAAFITIRRLRKSQQVQKTMFQTVLSCHKQSSKHLWSSLYSWDLSHVDTYLVSWLETGATEKIFKIFLMSSLVKDIFYLFYVLRIRAIFKQRMKVINFKIEFLLNL